MQSEQKLEVRVHIRWMIRRDMPEVLAIESENFEFPWLEEDFIRSLRQRNCIGMIAEHDDRVVGFMIYELHKTRIHVLNFAVAERFPAPRRGQPDARQADRQALAAAPQPDRARSPRDELVRAAVLPRERLPRGLGAEELLRRFARRRLPDAVSPSPRKKPATIPFNRITRMAG